MDIMKELNEIMKPDITTARGRNEIKGTEIPLKLEDNDRIVDATMQRMGTYLKTANHLYQDIAKSSYGIESEELERAEFMIEYFERSARVAFDEVRKGGVKKW